MSHEDDFPVSHHETIPAPFSAEEAPTNRRGTLASMLAPPERLEGAPEWAQQLFGTLQTWQRANREGIHDVRSSVQALNTNVELMAHEFNRFGAEVREREHGQDTRMDALERRVADLERRIGGH